MAKRPLLNCILALGLTLWLSACYQLPTQPDQSSSPPESSVPLPDLPPDQPLTLAAYVDQSFHPILSDNQVNRTLTPLIYEGLFRLDTSFTPQKQLCADYKISEDGLIWTFSLRRGVTFSDGTPLTAAHAVQSLELARTNASPYSGRFACISSVAAQDDYNLTITLSRPNTSLPALLDIPVVLGSADRPLGTGDYVLTQSPDDSLSLVPRDGVSPTIPVVSITRTRELTAAFERGALSLVATDPSGTLSPGYSGTYHTVDYDTTGLVYLGFNTARSPFASSDNRGATAAALNRSELVSTAWAGHARAAVLPIHPASPLYDESLTRQLPTPDDARKLLEQTGLSGRRITLIVNNENSYKVAAAQLIARQLEQAGLTVLVSALPWDSYLSALANGQFDLYLGEVNLTADFDLTPLLSIDGALNYSRWRSTQTTDLLTAFLSAPEQERTAAAGKLCTHLTQQMPLAPLCFKRGSVLTTWDRWTELTPTRTNVFFGIYN